MRILRPSEVVFANHRVEKEFGRLDDDNETKKHMFSHSEYERKFHY